MNRQYKKWNLFAPLVAILLTLCAHNATATQIEQEDESCCGTLHLLQPNGSANQNLALGTYLFGQFHSVFTPNFSDTWSFTLSQDSGVSLHFIDSSIIPGATEFVSSENLLLSVFDDQGHLLGSTLPNAELSLGTLHSGSLYSLVVSGVATGVFGGAYFGEMKICPPTAVPLGDTLPMFISAIVVSAWRFKSKARRRKA